MKEQLASLLGYMTEKQAIAEGFTHHGAMYGFPCWIGDPDGEAPMVATKWAPVEALVTLGHWITGFINWMRGDESWFEIYIGAEIEVKP